MSFSTRIGLLPLLILTLFACGSSGWGQRRAAQRRGSVEVSSDPAEYSIDRPSAEAGERIFTRTGIGDPYRTGFPYPVFLALLRMYPDELGADTQAFAARFGLIPRERVPSSEDADEREGLPIGMHLTEDPWTRVPFLVTNCALCHTERVRWPGGEATVVGLGNRHVRIHAYDNALADITRRPTFSSAAIAALAELAAVEHRAPWPAEWRAAFVDATVNALRVRAASRPRFLERVRHGPPGRVATMESFATALGLYLGRDIEMPNAIGWAKVPDIVGFAQRNTLSWDGDGEGAIDVLVVEADFVAGVRPEWYRTHPFQGASLSAYLRDLPRSLPFPGEIDHSLAERGRTLFAESCAGCHGRYRSDGSVESYRERVIPLDVLGTDPARADATTEDFVAAANDPRLQAFHGGLVRSRRTMGYVPPVLTDVWARAPYGHAGQWPSLRALATAPSERAIAYVADVDAPLDLDAMGVPTREMDPARPVTRNEVVWDATRAGFGVGGHPFLAELGDADARAVIEYLKTL